MNSKISVIGAGLAGCEAAWYLAQKGFSVDLYEMKPKKYSPAHKFSGFAELVCSNSLKAMRVESAAGLLKHEMNMFGSLILEAAEQNKVEAGGALAVDRENFSSYITEKIKNHENINVICGEVTKVPEDGYVIIATGPLTSDAFAEEIKEKYLNDDDALSFFDAAAPIVTFDSINMDKAFFAARYGRGDDDYINCPFSKDEYEVFHNELVNAESAPLKEIDKDRFKVYEGCMPVEVMGKRGQDTLRFGPLKPVGLRDPKTDKRPWAVCQLRKENSQGTLYNLVGFQTNLKFGEQKRVFSKIPGLENAEFVRYGVMHRNTFINSPKLLDCFFRLKSDNRIFFAGQITGVEGYTESCTSGIMAAFHLTRILQGKQLVKLPTDTMIGALSAYISDESVTNFQPMGANMGILPSLPERVKDKAERYGRVANIAINSLEKYLNEIE